MAQTYSIEFKEEACKRVQSGVPAAQVARELGVNVNTLYTWMSRFKEHPADPFVGSGNLHQEDAELRALKKRIKDLEEENEFLKKASAFFAKNLNGQLSYIKPANYEISKTRKYKNDIGKVENMEYDSESDSYTCRNSKKLTADHIRHSKSKTGYVSEKTIYKCEDCSGCPYKSDCIKGNNCKTPMEERTKTLQVAKTFLKHRKEDLERILSEEGILFRTNRSIQAEGSFGD